MRLWSPRKYWQQQADATLSQANPVSGTKYTVLDTTLYARIINIDLMITWTVQPTPLECHVTIDGQARLFTTANPQSDHRYTALIDTNPLVATDVLGIDLLVLHRSFLLEGKSIKIEAETTGGTVQNLEARVKYAKLV